MTAPVIALPLTNSTLVPAPSAGFGYLYVDNTGNPTVKLNGGTIIQPLINPMTTTGDIITGGALGVVQRLGIGTTGQVLKVVSGAPAWSSDVGFANPMTTSQDLIVGGASGAATRLGVGTNNQVLTVVSGTVTWQTPAAGFTNPMTTAGDIITGGSAGAAQRLAIGSTNQVLTVVAGAPAWAAAVGFANPMTTSGDLITGGASGAAQRLAGGTNGFVLTMVSGAPAWAAATGGFTNPMTTAGDIITATTGGTAQRLAVGTAGQVLTVVSGAPAWQTPSAGFTNPMTTAGDIITATTGGTAQRLGVGSANQVLTVVSGAPAWAAAVGFANPMTTSQDIIVGGVSGAAGRLAVGTNNQVLTVVSGSIAWATPSSGFTNPMTTAGDMITGGTAGAAQRLAIGTTGQILSVVSGAPAWSSFFGSTGQYILIQDQKTAGTNAQSSTTANATWFTRDMNTIVVDETGAVSVATNQITLPAGTYRIRGRVPSTTVGNFNSRWQNITDSVTTLPGCSSLGITTAICNTYSFVDGQFTIAATKTFALQEYYTAKVGNAYDLGVATNSGQNEVYGQVELLKITNSTSTFANPMTAAGDLIVGGSSGTPTRLAAGSNGQMLTLSGGTPAWVGGMQRIAQVVCAGSQSTVTFTSIPQTFTNLQLIVAARATGSVATANVSMMINSDATAADYSLTQYMLGGGNTPSANTQASSTSGSYVFTVAGTLNTSSPIGVNQLNLPSYTSTTLLKAFNNSGMLNLTTGSFQMQVYVMAGFWNSTAAITRLDFTIASGSFLDGSVFTLYGY